MHETINPEIIDQIVNPKDKTAWVNSHIPILWECDKGHQWKASPKTRQNDLGCPICFEPSPNKKPVQETHPYIAKELLNPIKAPAGSHKRADWGCSRGHTWSATFVSRTRLNSGCPVCSGALPRPGINDLATLYPQVPPLMVNPEIAKNVTAKSGKKVEWICEKGHIWSAEIRKRLPDRKGGPTGCPICTNRPKRTAQPTLEEVNHPELVNAVDPTTTRKLTLGSGITVEWYCTTCPQKHTYFMPVRKKIQGQGCPVAAEKQIIPGINDLKTTRPDIAKQLLDPTLATRLTKGSEAVTTWRCDNNHTWKAPVYSRMAGNECPHCTKYSKAKLEEKVFQITSVFNPKAIKNAIITHNKEKHEIDILSGDLAIEFNGLYWHSEQYQPDKNYHKNKVEAIRANNLSPYFIWEDDWNNQEKRKIIIRTLAYKHNKLNLYKKALKVANIESLYDPKDIQKIGAKKLTPKVINGKQARKFLDENHIQGFVTANAHLALIDNSNNIRAIMSLRSAQMSVLLNRVEGEWDIQRYATQGIIPGGFTKLLKFAEETIKNSSHNLKSFITMSANDISNGDLYHTSGFKKAGNITPNYTYVGKHTKNIRKTKEGFQKKHFKENPQLLYNPNLTEHELALKNKLYRVYDAGKTKWIKTIS